MTELSLAVVFQGIQLIIVCDEFPIDNYYQQHSMAAILWLLMSIGKTFAQLSLYDTKKYFPVI